MTLDQIKEEVKRKLPIDKTKLGDEALNNVDLFIEFRNMLSDARTRLRVYSKKMQKLLIDKRLYYSGKAEPDVYREKPFNMKLRVAEIDEYIKADPEVSTLDDKIFMCEECISYLEDVLKTIRDRGFQVKNKIEYEKFIHGE